MQMTPRDREMIVLGMILAEPHAKWVQELAKVLPPNGDLSSTTVEAICSGDDKKIKQALPGSGIERKATFRRGVLRRVIWDISRKVMQQLATRLKWSHDENDRIEVTSRIAAYSKQADGLLTRWEPSNVESESA